MIVAVAVTAAPRSASAKTGTSHFIGCPTCHKRIDSAETICPRCLAPTTVGAVSGGVACGTKFLCSSCSLALAPGTQRCGRCGTGVVKSRKRGSRAKPAKPVAEPRVVERVVERQVLVTRCQYCKKLTPVDLTECKQCGAVL